MKINLPIKPITSWPFEYLPAVEKKQVDDRKSVANHLCQSLSRQS